MPFGIEVYNIDNYLTISETYSNYTLVSTGTGNNSTPNPLTGDQIAVFRPLSSNSTFTVGVPLEGIYASWGGSNGATWVWTQNNVGFKYAILQPYQSNVSGLGLAVYNSNGIPQFDSNRKPVVPIYQYRRTTGSTFSSWSFSPTLPALSGSGRERYVTLGKATGFTVIGAGAGLPYFVGTLTSFSSDTTPTMSESVIASGGGYLRAVFGNEKYFLFVDI